jgi:hypothetical protein
VGIKWKKTRNNRGTLIERDDVRSKRVAYLRAIRKYRERERERERKLGGVVVRDTTMVGGQGNNIFGLKVPRQCPLGLLIGVRLEFRIHSTILMLMELEGLHWSEI